MGTMEPPSWKSLRKRKHDDWSFAEVQACAAAMKDELPSQLHQIVEDPQYVGGTLIALINPPKVTWRDVTFGKHGGPAEAWQLAKDASGWHEIPTGSVD